MAKYSWPTTKYFYLVHASSQLSRLPDRPSHIWGHQPPWYNFIFYCNIIDLYSHIQYFRIYRCIYPSVRIFLFGAAKVYMRYYLLVVYEVLHKIISKPLFKPTKEIWWNVWLSIKVWSACDMCMWRPYQEVLRARSNAVCAFNTIYTSN